MTRGTVLQEVQSARLQCRADRDRALMKLELTSEKIKVAGVVHARA